MSCNCQNTAVVDVRGLVAKEVSKAIEKAEQRRAALYDNPVSADRSNQDRLIEAAHLLREVEIYDCTAADLINIATYIKEN